MKITKSDIKGVFKVLLVILLVVGAVGLTCYLFFKYLGKQKDSYTELNTYLYATERAEFLSDVKKVNTKSDGGLALLITNYDVITGVAVAITPYLTTYDVDDDLIINKLNDLTVAENACKDTLTDYLGRINDPAFQEKNVSTVYESLSNYLVTYSKMISVINTQIEAHSKYKNVDAKFSVIDCYCRVVETTFSDLTDYQVKNEQNLANLNVINSVVKFDNINIKTNEVADSAINNFIANYNVCDKDAFAKNVKDVENYKTLKADASVKDKAYHYFYVVFMPEV